MDRLPEELVSYLFEFFHAANALSSAMLANRRWYLCGARNLHHRIVLTLTPGLTVSSCDVRISFMKRLVSPTLSTAHLIHHLHLSGFAGPDIQELILCILHRASALRLLDVHALHMLPSGMQIPSDVFSSKEFLPSLTALNASSNDFFTSLSRTRQLTSVRVHETIDEARFRQALHPFSHLSARIERFELVLAVGSLADAIARTAHLATTLAAAPLCTLGLQFVLDRPGPISWSEYEVRPIPDLCAPCCVNKSVTHGIPFFLPSIQISISEMGRSLQMLPNLRTLSLVVRPEPIIPVPPNADVGPGEQHREAMTKGIAERLVRDHGLVGLKRVELRWHGWEIRDGGDWISLPRTQLMRLPHAWLPE